MRPNQLRRREFITLLGATAVTSRGARAATGEAGENWILGLKFSSGPEPMDRRL